MSGISSARATFCSQANLRNHENPGLGCEESGLLRAKQGLRAQSVGTVAPDCLREIPRARARCPQAPQL